MKVFVASEFRTHTPVEYGSDLSASGIYMRFGKRGLDIVLALLMMPVIVPVIAVLWYLAKRDGGPGFYSQKRIGQYGRVFRCWKLRTMVVNAEQALKELCDGNPALAAEWHRNQKLAADPRITPIGQFLRATSLDELPQIWNVLIGDMSFVGPRPFMAKQKKLYCAAGGAAYFQLRPGITGPWQIDGRGTTSFVDRIKFDNAYLAELSLGRDLRFILRTVLVVLNRTGH